MQSVGPTGVVDYARPALSTLPVRGLEDEGPGDAETVIAADVFNGFLELLDEKRSSVHGFFAAVPSEYFDDHASELLYDRAIRWGIENGYETYDFGSTNSSFENGVFRFKEGFGGRIVPILVWERGCSVLWKLVKTGRSLYWPYRYN